jgi:hypothetical protein
LLRPSTTPDDISPLARNQFRINASNFSITVGNCCARRVGAHG